MGAFTAIALATTAIAGTAMTAYGQYKQGQQQGEAMAYNAAVARRQAENLRVAGELEAYRYRVTGERFTARQSVLYAKSGVLLRGSPLEVIEDSMAKIELDADIARYNVSIGAQTLESEAQEKERASRYYKQAGYIEWDSFFADPMLPQRKDLPAHIHSAHRAPMSDR